MGSFHCHRNLFIPYFLFQILHLLKTWSKYDRENDFTERKKFWWNICQMYPLVYFKTLVLLNKGFVNLLFFQILKAFYATHHACNNASPQYNRTRIYDRNLKVRLQTLGAFLDILLYWEKNYILLGNHLFCFKNPTMERVCFWHRIAL